MNYKELLNNLNGGFIGRDKWILKRHDLELKFYKDDALVFKIIQFKSDMIFNPLSNVNLTGYELSLLIEFSRSYDWLNLIENRSADCPNIDNYNARIIKYLMDKDVDIDDFCDKIAHISDDVAYKLLIKDNEMTKFEYDMIKEQIDEYLEKREEEEAYQLSGGTLDLFNTLKPKKKE